MVESEVSNLVVVGSSPIARSLCPVRLPGGRLVLNQHRRVQLPYRVLLVMGACCTGCANLSDKEEVQVRLLVCLLCEDCD